jgi:hypothetical protein
MVFNDEDFFVIEMNSKDSGTVKKNKFKEPLSIFRIRSR